MESVIKQLVKIGHGMGAEVANDEPAVAKLLVELSSALDVQYERANALEAKCAALAAENVAMKTAAIFLSDEAAEIYRRWNLIQQPDGDIIDMETIQDLSCACHETPATDSFLAEVRAQGVDGAIDAAKKVVAQEFQYQDFKTAQRVCIKFPESDLVGKVEMVEWMEEFAAQLRQEAAQ